MLKNEQNKFRGNNFNRGIAYAEVENDESLKEALFNSGKELNNRKINIYKALKKQ